MLDLDCTREAMLADIHAGTEHPTLTTLGDPVSRACFVTSETARLVVRVITPDAILPVLDLALLERFANEPRKRLERSLLRPLKKTVGNAHKRGNRRDKTKRIRVEVIVTRSGAYIEVSDEGQGFDFEATCAQFLAGERYFTHGGSGFRTYQKARGPVGFDHGGSTVRFCYRCTHADGITDS
jgi:hypothetical protein